MTTEPGRPSGKFDELLRRQAERRRTRLQSEIRRNREGGHLIPTWVMAVVLAAFLLGWAYLLVIR